MKFESLIKQMTLEQKCSLLSGETWLDAKSLDQLGITPICMGLKSGTLATCFPTAAAVANSWDVDLAEEIGRYIGREARCQKVNVLLEPGLNIKRNPLCGSNFEYFSEDPYLSGKLAAAYIRGVQANGIAACPKYYAVNSRGTLRMGGNSIVDQRALREIYLTGFEIAVKEGQPRALMSSCNLVNGEYTSESKKLLQDILRDEWGFDGFVVTDWSGLDDQDIIEAVYKKKIPEEFVDKRVDELLAVWMDITIPEGEEHFDSSEHHCFARKAASETVVLLKNAERILPLDDGTKIAVIGDFAENPRFQGNGPGMINCTRLDIPIKEIRQSSLDYIGYAKGFDRFGKADKKLADQAVSLAKRADVILFYMGLDETAETAGLDRRNMKINENQIQLLRRIYEINSNIVVIISAGSSVEMPWKLYAKAIVHGYLGGQAGAGAMVDVLTGKVNPSGKLAESYPFHYRDVPGAADYSGTERNVKYKESIYVGYRYYEKAGIQVKYPFGFGLSYTRFLYYDLKYEDGKVTFFLKNIGAVSGAEICQLYIACSNQEVFFPVKELKGFKKVYLEAGESRSVEILLDDKAFRFYNAATRKFETAEGEYDILIGASSEDIRLETTVTLDGNVELYPYSRRDLDTYWSGKVAAVSDHEFEKLLGHKLPPTEEDRHSIIGRNDPVCRIGQARSPLARLIFRIMERRKIRAERSGKPNINILFIYNMPFRGISKISGGKCDSKMIDALLLIVNGYFFKGIRHLFSAYRKMKKAQRG